MVEFTKLNDESVNTIFGNIGKGPKDPKWGEGPPLEKKEKKVLKERLQVLAEEPWRQQYVDLMLRYYDVLSKDKFDLGCADVIKHSIVMEDKRLVHQEYRLRTSTVCARGSAVRVRGQVAQVVSNRGQPLTIQLGSVLRSEEAAPQCSTWRSGTTTRST
jgi:hypothetical protein